LRKTVICRKEQNGKNQKRAGRFEKASQMWSQHCARIARSFQEDIVLSSEEKRSPEPRKCGSGERDNQ